MSFVARADTEQLLTEKTELWREIRSSQTKILVELVVGTMALAVWRMAGFAKGGGADLTTGVAMSPFAINMAAWFFWTIQGYSKMIRPMIGRGRRLPMADDLLQEYELSQLVLRSQKRFEIIFDTLLGFQFLSMIAGALLLISHVNRAPVIQ